MMMIALYDSMTRTVTILAYDYDVEDDEVQEDTDNVKDDDVEAGEDED